MSRTSNFIVRTVSVTFLRLLSLSAQLSRTSRLMALGSNSPGALQTQDRWEEGGRGGDAGQKGQRETLVNIPITTTWSVVVAALALTRRLFFSTVVDTSWGKKGALALLCLLRLITT